MLTAYVPNGSSGLVRSDTPETAIMEKNVVWVDLLTPSVEEEDLIERMFDVDAPTAAERRALEDSSRFWHGPGTVQAAATLVCTGPDDYLDADEVTFILRDRMLITVRDISPRAFTIGKDRSSARVFSATDGAGVLYALLESISERSADILEIVDKEAEAISNLLFGPGEKGKTRGQAEERACARLRGRQIRRIGFLGARTAKAAESLNSLVRLVAYIEGCGVECGLDPERTRAQRKDFEQLDRYADGLTERLTFLLDAAFGLIAAEQNQSIRIITVFSVVFAPPTLIASIYGMNFPHMPELAVSWGYPAALGAMAVMALATGIWAWRRGWFG